VDVTLGRLVLTDVSGQPIGPSKRFKQCKKKVLFLDFLMIMGTIDHTETSVGN